MKQTTLFDLLDASGVDYVGQRLQWMVLTWDLSGTRGQANRYWRALMTDDNYLAATGYRSPRVFADNKPNTGSYVALSLGSGAALQAAMDLTEVQLADGFTMLCRPLAVDCSIFEGARSTGGGTLSDAGSLLGELIRRTTLGLRVLAHVNAARAAARTTHLAPDWRATGCTDSDRLWEGR